MTPDDEICGKCGKEKSGRVLGSITQWLLHVDSCTCDRLKVAPEFNQEVELCSTCGLRLPSGRPGSMTQWIFSSSICKCQAPHFAEEALTGTLGEREPGQSRESADDVTEEPEREPELELDPTRFPTQRYRATKVLGKGGSGFVYLCHDRLLNKKVAVKTLRQLSAEQLISFQTEARANSKLNHPAILQLLDFGPTESGSPYMVLEYFESITLADYLEEQGPLSVIDAVHVFERVTSALAAAHEQGIFHRDLKPSNILISTKLTNEPPEIRLIDFGVAEIQRNTMPIVVEGQKLAGTPSYMAPDTFLGKTYDARSEVYSLGCVLFESLSGIVPFSGESAMEILNQHARKVPPRLSETVAAAVHHDVDALVSRCLEKEPASRYSSMQELQDAIVRLPSSPAPGLALSQTIRKPHKLNSKKLALIAIPVLLLGAGAYYLFATTHISQTFDAGEKASVANNADDKQKNKKRAAAEGSSPASEKAELVYFEKILGNSELEEKNATDPIKQYRLGECYQFGQGVPTDYARSLYWYRKAAENGDVAAMAKVGFFHQIGKGGKPNYEEALKWYRKAIDHNSSVAMGNLGIMYQNGKGVKQSYPESIKWFRKAVAMGDPIAQSHLGDAYKFGWGVPLNDAEAVRLFKLSAAQNNSMGMANLGSMYIEGRGVAQDVEKGLELYKRSAKLGDMYAMHDLGEIYEHGEVVHRDYKKAAEYYSSASHLGYAASTNNLGWLYQEGHGVPQDYKEAMRLYLLAEEKGNTSATCNIGYLYEMGLGVPVNHKRAFQYYKESADMGNTRGINSLGWAYQDGIGVKKNYKEAFRLYKQAADLDYELAIDNLGCMYRDGLGVKKDLKEAVRLFQMSAAYGCSRARFHLGQCFENGIGVERNMASAITWYESAAKRDFQLAKDRLKALRKH